jgi:hypothetical protein
VEIRLDEFNVRRNSLYHGRRLENLQIFEHLILNKYVGSKYVFCDFSYCIGLHTKQFSPMTCPRVSRCPRKDFWCLLELFTNIIIYFKLRRKSTASNIFHSFNLLRFVYPFFCTFTGLSKIWSMVQWRRKENWPPG